MDLVDAYRTFNLAPGAPEAQVRAVHRDMTAAWHPDRFRADPAMHAQAIAATDRLNAAFAAIAAAGFAYRPPMQPPPMQPPPMQPMQQGYPQQPQPYAQQPQMPQQQAYPPPQAAMYPPPGMAQGGYRPPQPMGAPLDAAAQKRKHAGANIGIGILLIVIGVAITVGTKDAAESNGGGTYIVAYGPIVVGVIRLLKGLAQLAG